ncbi:MAG: helix-turn-helix domain-containing protein [Lachnospiraceae bacterium]|nr:helix-turn-helix domain-containing protein [Lachnospiraceae bacterium]
MDNKVFSSTLQSLRKEKKVTQEQLATHLGVSPQAVSKWENGSYPEGDLLPAIADYFEVSIDYLYGRGGRDKSFEQIVFEKIREVSIKDFERDGKAETHRELLRLIKNIQWAIQTGSWINNETFFERPNDPLDYPKMGSVVLDNLLYSYMGLREDNDFHLFLSSPEDKSIFEKLFRDTGKVEALFRFLSDRDHIAIVAYLYSLAQEEYAGVDTIAKATGVKKEKVSAALDELVHKICASPNPAITFVKEVTSDKENVIYGVNPGLGGLFIGLMMVAAEYTAPPEGYSMQINCRTKSWLEKKKK